MEKLIKDESEESGICVDFLLQYILYSILTADEVGFSIHGADHVMATGFNWCPPLAMVQAFSNVCDFKALMSERLDADIQTKISLDRFFSLLEPSCYDYRRYLCAAR